MIQSWYRDPPGVIVYPDSDGKPMSDNTNRLQVYLRQGDMLKRKRDANGFMSPRLGIRFDLAGPEMMIYRPDGRPFLTLPEIDAEHQAAEERVSQAEQRASQAELRASQAEQRAARVLELVRKLRRGQLAPEELAELEALERMQQPPAP